MNTEDLQEYADKCYWDAMKILDENKHRKPCIVQEYPADLNGGNVNSFIE
ncbi:hypothetical protein LCGC14_3002140 [marine sediment metagenome]|uniref:Uncharacterized protein n=1 Tax=marine sediment metagenome TaxID=412755 RepID=A0A0F8XNA7_9ZZZZ